MEFRIADTFTGSLAKLTGEEQKAAKMTAFDLQLNPAHPGLKLHKLDKSKDPNFWSIRVNSDIRLIVHRTGSSLLLCYVDHHEQAYQWAERRKLETHPKTGAAQLVEIRERVHEVPVPRYIDVETPAPPKPKVFRYISDGQFLAYGVPQEWLADVRDATDDTILEIADHLPAEAAEAILNLAIGIKPITIKSVPQGRDPFEHPDALRRFRVMKNVEELTQALDYPWERWVVFLHPEQRRMVERDFNGPARVAGSAGTGKTIVALHRAVHLAKANPNARVLLTTFSIPLANLLMAKLRLLIGSEPRLGDQIEVYSLDVIGRRLYELNIGKPKILSPGEAREMLVQASSLIGGHTFSDRFLASEWEQVVDAWQLQTWESYRDVARLGRKSKLNEVQRQALWSMFSHVQAEMKKAGQITLAGLFNCLRNDFTLKSSPPFDFVVVDEAQDISLAQLRFLATITGSRRNSLFFAGDLGQRIFQAPFSWKACGVDVRGRSITLKINYRTSHQIRSRADYLLSPELADVDGNAEERRGTVSVFNGPSPDILVFNSAKEESLAVGRWVKDRINSGVEAQEIAVFTRTAFLLQRAKEALIDAGLAFTLLDDGVDVRRGMVSISSMHLAKGMEFRAVAVVACDDDVLPLQERIDAVADESELEDVYNTERHLLYVACTRARDHLLVTGTRPASEFLDDLVR